ncbi:hypothetical protein Misp01_41120 [Microtetraspora sp. NBRC 13810]|nr:hypothetical protein Misp01_41120 [Microtetraspora sp. NBRC 13810]
MWESREGRFGVWNRPSVFTGRARGVSPADGGTRPVDGDQRERGLKRQRVAVRPSAP